MTLALYSTYPLSVDVQIVPLAVAQKCLGTSTFDKGNVNSAFVSTHVYLKDSSTTNNIGNVLESRTVRKAFQYQCPSLVFANLRLALAKVVERLIISICAVVRRVEVLLVTRIVLVVNVLRADADFGTIVIVSIGIVGFRVSRSRGSRFDLDCIFRSIGGQIFLPSFVAV